MTVEIYLSALPESQRERAEALRDLIQHTAPEAVEHFAYGMPAYKLRGKHLVYFAAFKNHLGVYALPAAHTEFASELAGYKQGKGSVQFPWAQPLPLELIERMVAWNAGRIPYGKTKRVAKPKFTSRAFICSLMVRRLTKKSRAILKAEWTAVRQLPRWAQGAAIGFWILPLGTVWSALFISGLRRIRRARSAR